MTPDELNFLAAIAGAYLIYEIYFGKDGLFKLKK